MAHNVKRIQADIAEIQKPLYADQGIFYEADENDLTQGHLLIWGPKDTVYEDMPMVYRVQFPVQYPFENPRVQFLTSDGETRFHPNMYREGKVCLSILGTWQGPSWAATMRLSTVAVTIQSLMDQNPIAHEPGWENRVCESARGYNELIRSRCIGLLCNFLQKTAKKEVLPQFMKTFQEDWNQRCEGIAKRLQERIAKEMECEEGKRTWVSVPYGLKGSIQYGDLQKRLQNAVDKIDFQVLRGPE